MKKKLILVSVVLVSVVIGSIFYFSKSGNDFQVKEINPAFTSHIASFTSGVISKKSEIVVQLRQGVDGVVVDEPIDNDIFDFEPSVDGQTYWKDDRTIVFKPEENLPSGVFFDAEFNLGEIKEVSEDLEVLSFNFQTMHQGVTVYYEKMEPYDDLKPQLQKVIGSVVTADVANDETIENIFNAEQEGNKLNITWLHNGDEVNHSFVIDSILRKEEKSSINLSWDAESIGAEENDPLNIEIPALGDFKVMNVRVYQQPNQYVSIIFSDAVKPGQDLNGLIYFSKAGNDKIRMQVKSNEVKIFPERRLEGNVNLVVTDKVKNILDYSLQKEFKQTLSFFNTKPAIELIGEGVILPSTDGLIFPFKAVNLQSVQVKIVKIFEDNMAQFFQVNQFDGNYQMKRVGRIVYKNEVFLKSDQPIDYGSWNTFSLDLSSIISVDPGSLYRVSLSFTKKQSLYPCGEKDENELEDQWYLQRELEEEREYDAPDNNYYDDYYYGDYYDYGYDWNERENPCHISYYRYYGNNTTVSRNVFASDLGIIAKGGNTNSVTVAVSDMVSTESLSGVELKLLNYQQQVIATGTTDQDGFATIPVGSKPFLLVAKSGNQSGYLRLDDGEALSMSMFDVGGQAALKGVKGFVYGERDVWRPGDSLYVSFMLEDKNDVIPENHPVVMELYTPENQLYSRKVSNYSVNGLYDFRTKTEIDAPTGSWVAKFKVGGSTFNERLRIEAIKPNRLKINIDFGAEILQSDINNGELSSKWLHGATAKGLKADIEMTLAQGKTTFKGYEEYHFDDDSKEFSSEEQKIFEGNLNSEGSVKFFPNIKVGNDAPGMLKAQFKTRVFEQGGDFSIDRYVIPYSPFKSYAGLKIPEGPGWNGAHYSNEPLLINVASVFENGKPTAKKKLKVEIFDIKWRWWWERRSYDDLAHYVNGSSSSKVHTGYVETQNGKAMYELNLGDEYWGRRFIKVTDPVSGHSTGKIVYFSYKGWWNRNDGGSADMAIMLNFSTNKEKYQVGEQVMVQLPKGEQGKALISVETGSKVLQTAWLDLSSGNEFYFEATPEMAPNAFVNITLIQPHNQTANNLPIRLYGVQPIFVEDPETILKPVIKMPKELTPEKDVTIEISEANGKDMTFTISVVDEGLLDLTRFKTPDPWNHFYAKEALKIKTWDMYKYVIGAFSGKMSGLLALGGDEFIKNDEGNDVNRFKPVVKHFGPFFVEGGDEKEIKFTMPNYIGSVRTMVVAHQEGAYGKAENTTPVKKPLMVLATLPRVLGPTEQVKLPVTIFSMDEKIREATVKVETNSILKVNGAKTQKVKFDGLGEKIIDFDLSVAAEIGAANVTVTVAGGGYEASYDIELAVRVPNPPASTLTFASVVKGESWSTDYSPFGVLGTRSGTVEITSLPPLGLEKRLKYLIRYPHGCIEQTTSSVFPQLFLNRLVELSTEQQKEVEENIKSGLKKLRSFQRPDGGFAYWPGGSNSDPWGSNYAGHFMVEAKNAGYSLPIGLLDQWVQYQTQEANSWRQNIAYRYPFQRKDDQLTQSYRLYTLALAKKPALGAMNRMREMNNLESASQWRLAAAYQLSGKTEVAKEIIAGLSTDTEEYTNFSSTYGSKVRDQAMIMETMLLLEDNDMAFRLLKDLSEVMVSSRWLSTQSTAYILLAAGKMMGNSIDQSNVSYEITLNGKKEEINMGQIPIKTHVLKVYEIEKGKVQVQNNSEVPLFVSLVLEGTPIAGQEQTVSSDLSLDINYTDMDGKSINPDKLAQGTDFIAEVTITHPGIRGDYRELALNQIFPSGWEIRNLRMDEVQNVRITDTPDYQDIRDDRVYSYFNLGKSKSRTFKILLNAAYKGKFYMPSVKAEAMYDISVQAVRTGKWVEVTGVEDGTN